MFSRGGTARKTRRENEVTKKTLCEEILEQTSLIAKSL
jgi:hypothetical protein